MDFQEYSPLDQVPPAVDMGIVAPALPSIQTLRELCDAKPITPPQIIAGILHQGCKLILSGTSKSNKSWCLLDLACSVACGVPWWGRKTIQGDVLYINFELQPWAIHERLLALAGAKQNVLNGAVMSRLHVWNLRGHNSDLALLRPTLMNSITPGRFSLIIIDPAYKVLGDRDENSNGEIASLMNEFEAIAKTSGAAVILAHHFAKGDSTAKSASDRMSGAGAWTRDPDALLVLTPHEEEDCFTVTSILRNLPRLPEFVVKWDYPTMEIVGDLDPDSLRRPQSKNKSCSDSDFVDWCITSIPQSRSTVVDLASEKGISRATCDRFLKRLSEKGLIHCGQGSYWK